MNSEVLSAPGRLGRCGGNDGAGTVGGNSLAGYSGLLDLGLVALILSGAGWILYIAARKIFIEEA